MDIDIEKGDCFLIHGFRLFGEDNLLRRNGGSLFFVLDEVVAGHPHVDDPDVVAEVEGVFGDVITIVAFGILVEFSEVFVEQRLVLEVLLTRLTEVPLLLPVFRLHVLEEGRTLLESLAALFADETAEALRLVHEALVRVEVGPGGGGELAALHVARERPLDPVRPVRLRQVGPHDCVGGCGDGGGVLGGSSSVHPSGEEALAAEEDPRLPVDGGHVVLELLLARRGVPALGSSRQCARPDLLLHLHVAVAPVAVGVVVVGGAVGQELVFVAETTSAFLAGVSFVVESDMALEAVLAAGREWAMLALQRPRRLDRRSGTYAHFKNSLLRGLGIFSHFDNIDSF